MKYHPFPVQGFPVVIRELALHFLLIQIGGTAHDTPLFIQDVRIYGVRRPMIVRTHFLGPFPLKVFNF